MTKALAALALLLVLTGCSPISRGTVTDKDYAPGHYITTLICLPAGKTTVCHPQLSWIPDNWTLSIREGKESGWVDVSQSTYDDYKVGDYYPRGDIRE